MKDMKYFYYILLLLAILCLANVFSADAATYTTKNNINGTFEDASTWVGGILPGTYSDNTFTVNSNSNMKANGIVYLNGNLDMENRSTLTISENSTLIITGDLTLSDLSEINLSNSSSLYVKGNVYTLNKSNEEYTFIYMNSYANFVCEKNVNSTSGANIYFYQESGYFSYDGSNVPDVYIFGSLNGTAYKRRFSDVGLDNEETFEKSEKVLQTKVADATAIHDNCALTIESGKTVLIQEGTTINITALTIEPGAELQNYGTINFVKTCDDIETLSDCNIKGSYYKNNGVDYSGKFLNGNTGTINCDNFSYSPSVSDGGTMTFSNAGTINADSVYLHYDENIYVSTSCNSVMKARSIYIVQDNGPDIDALTLNGVYIAEDVKIYSSQGNVPIEFGGDCGDSDIDITNLTLTGNGSVLNVNELTGVDNLIIKTSTTLNVEGILILGKITSNNNEFKINTSANSLLSLCYNPSKGDDNLDWYSNSTLNGNVSYLSDEGLTDAEKISLSYTVTTYAPGEHQHWHPSGTSISTVYHVWEGSDTPVSEGDIALGSSGKLYKYTTTYGNCLTTPPSLLPITLTYFKIDGDQFKWETASEENNNFFVVEYSMNGTDWSVCTERQYSMSDNGWVYDCAVPEWTKESTFSYYRLKQVDFDGKYSYSDILSTSWKVQAPQYQDKEYSKAYITSDGKILYNYDHLPNGVYIEKSENGIRKIVKVK